MGADPFAVLGIEPSASPEEVSAAYRRLAKRWHPDRGGGREAAARMAEINAAYDLVRAERWLAERSLATPVAPAPRPTPASPRAAGSWLAPSVRRALGRELLAALEEGEDVALVTPVSVWASPQALLVVTDRRLLWLLDDAPTHRVRSLRLRDVAAAEQRRRPLARSASVRVRTVSGRRLTFAELRPATAAAVVARLRLS